MPQKLATRSGQPEAAHMTEKRPEWGVQVTAWRYGPRSIVIDWRTLQVGWQSTPPARGQHERIILDYTAAVTPAHLTVLVGRAARYILIRKGWKCQLPSGIPFRVIGDEVASVPPSGGEGGENPAAPLPGQEPLPGLDIDATIISPPPPVKLDSVPEPKARGRSPRSKAAGKGEGPA